MRLHNAKIFARRTDNFLYSFNGLPILIYPKISEPSHYLEDSLERLVLIADLILERSIGIFSCLSFLLTVSLSLIISLYCAKKLL